MRRSGVLGLQRNSAWARRLGPNERNAPVMGLELPAWLRSLDEGAVFRGFDDEPDLSALEGLSEDELVGLEELADLTDEQRQALVDAKEDGGGGGGGNADVTRLQEALRKERTQRRQLAKDLKAAKAAQIEAKSDADKKEKDEETKKASDALAAAQGRLTKVAARLLDNAVENAVVRTLQNPKLGVKFRDPDDVLRLLNRDSFDVEQDDDDPSKIAIDQDELTTAIKALAKAKPHLLVPKEGEGEGDGKGEGGDGKSGSGFGGRGKRATDAATRRAELNKKYPALNR